MEELRRVGERVAAEQAAGFDSAGDADVLGNEALASLLANGSQEDLEKYLEGYEQMLSQGLSPGQPQLNVVDSEGGVTVKPEPGFVIKTRDTQTGQKVFINVTASEHVEAPHLQSLADMEGEEGVRVPLSVGTPVEDFDKKHEPCLTYDLVANPETVFECNKTPEFRESVALLCIAAVAQKYKVDLDQRYKLPKIKYKGTTVQLQRIRVKHNSKIQEVSSSRDPTPGLPVPGGGASNSTGHLSREAGGLPSPDFCVFYALREAKPAAARLDGFAVDWGAQLAGDDRQQQEQEQEQHERSTYINGFDLPCYRVDSIKENIRGMLVNESQKQTMQLGKERALAAAFDSTRKMLDGRVCIVQVRLPDLEQGMPALKQFRAEISNECLRLSFPMLPRSSRVLYAPLTIWWPVPFNSAEATADWDAGTDTLVVSLPATEPPDLWAFD